MRNARPDELQAKIKIVGKNINNLRYADDIILKAGSEEELRNLLMRKESGKSWLKTKYLKNYDHGIWPHHFMVNRREKSRNSDRLYNLGLSNQLMVTTALKLKDACSLEERL